MQNKGCFSILLAGLLLLAALVPVFLLGGLLLARKTATIKSEMGGDFHIERLPPQTAPAMQAMQAPGPVEVESASAATSLTLERGQSSSGRTAHSPDASGQGRERLALEKNMREQREVERLAQEAKMRYDTTIRKMEAEEAMARQMRLKMLLILAGCAVVFGGMLFLGLIAFRLAARRGKAEGTAPPGEADALAALHQNYLRMEERLRSLETLLLAGGGKTRE